jgi:hypothetical protein
MPSLELENNEAQTSFRLPTPRENEPLDDLDEARASTDAEESDDDSEDENPLWTTVRRNRAQSLDSAKNNLKNKKLIYLKSSTLSIGQKNTVTDEKKTSTLVQEKAPERRQREDSPESKPTRNKGKGVDPREWGNSGIDPKEIDLDEQQAMLDAYKSNRKKTGRRPRKSKNKQDTSSDESEPEEIFQIPLVAR